METRYSLSLQQHACCIKGGSNSSLLWQTHLLLVFLLSGDMCMAASCSEEKCLLPSLSWVVPRLIQVIMKPSLAHICNLPMKYWGKCSVNHFFFLYNKSERRDVTSKVKVSNYVQLFFAPCMYMVRVYVNMLRQ